VDAPARIDADRSATPLSGRLVIGEAASDHPSHGCPTLRTDGRDDAEPMTTDSPSSDPTPAPGARHLIRSKLVVPRSHKGTVRRTRLLRDIRAARDRRLVSIVAPAGYGKTQMLAQWATADGRAVAWLTADDSDNDPVTLLTYLAASLGQVVPIEAGLFDAIASPAVSARASVGRLVATLDRATASVLLVIDDAHRIRDRTCLDVLAELIGHVPDRCAVAIASREPADLPFPRWRAEGWLLELGSDALRMDDHEAEVLLRHLGVRLPASGIGELVQRTEGWPALLALAGLAGGRSGSGRPLADGPVERSIADYLRSELLAHRTADEIRFLTRTSILERLSGPLCDAVVGRQGSSVLLAYLARSTLLVDEYGGWYRYHPLLREVLREELAIGEPGAVAEAHRRAAAWFGAAGDLDDAVGHAFAARDIGMAAVLVGKAMVRNHWSGRRLTTRAWLARFSDADLVERPWLAVLAAWETMSSGEPASTDHFADLAERGSFEGRPPDGTASFESGRAILRACMGRGGVDEVLRDAERGVELEPLGSPWRDLALWMLAFGRIMAGDAGGADEALAEAIIAADAAASPAIRYCLLGHRALLAIDRRDWAAARSYVAEGRSLGVTGLIDGYLTSVGARVAEIHLAVHDGRLAAARRELARAAGLRPILTWNAPGPAVVFLLGLARAHLAVGDAAGASTLLSQATGVLRRRPGLGVLGAEVAALRATVTDDAVGSGASTLTAAELRVLSWLPYYLSFKEIGERLGVRESTIKTQALAIYGKLGSSSRGEAVERAVEAGLLEPFPVAATGASSVTAEAARRGA
jgi:LuxR family maltose regulon positive regulatory protein